jgi:hypothetical protein
MDITVTFDNGRWITDPSPALVAVGTRVRWILRAPEIQTQLLLWKVHFKDSLPFGENYQILEVKTQFSGARQRRAMDREILQSLGLSEDTGFNHRGVTQYHSAEKPGEYKYDLSVQDAATGERIGDDDPFLYVLRGVMMPTDFVGF